MSFDGDLYPEAGATSVMTTKGDMVDFDAIRQRLAIGSANQILQVKSALPSWQTVPLADTVLTTGGDLLYEDATPALARLPIASNGDVLTLAGGLPSWVTPAGGATTTVRSSHLTSSLTTTSTTMVDSGLTFTCGSSGKIFCNMALQHQFSASDNLYFQWVEGTNAQTQNRFEQRDANTPQTASSRPFAVACSSQVIKVQVKIVGGNTLTLRGDSDGESCIYGLEVA